MTRKIKGNRQIHNYFVLLPSHIIIHWKNLKKMVVGTKKSTNIFVPIPQEKSAQCQIKKNYFNTDISVNKLTCQMKSADPEEDTIMQFVFFNMIENSRIP